MFILVIWRVAVPTIPPYFFGFSTFSALLPPDATNTLPALPAEQKLTCIFLIAIADLPFSYLFGYVYEASLLGTFCHPVFVVFIVELLPLSSFSEECYTVSWHPPPSSANVQSSPFPPPS